MGCTRIISNGFSEFCPESDLGSCEVRITHNINHNPSVTGDISNDASVLGQVLILDWGFMIQLDQEMFGQKYLVGSTDNNNKN